MSETGSSLRSSPYLEAQDKGINLSSCRMRGSERESLHHERSSDGSHGNSSNDGKGSAVNEMKGSEVHMESRNDNHSEPLNKQNECSEEVKCQSQPSSGNSEELPPRILLFSPSPDKAASPHNDRSHAHGRGHSRHYDRGDSNNEGDADGGNNGSNLPPSSSPQNASQGSIKREEGGGMSDHVGSGQGGAMSDLPQGHSGKQAGLSSRPSSMAPSKNAHDHDRLPVGNESSSSSALYSHRERDSFGGGGGHTSMYGGHSGGGGRRFAQSHPPGAHGRGGGHGYEDPYQLHGHHDHLSQRHSSHDSYYEHSNPRASCGTGPLDGGGAASLAGANRRDGPSYSRQGMQASRLAYEHDLHNDHPHNSANTHHRQPPTPSSGYHPRYNADRRKEDMINYLPPQASPTDYDRYGHRPSSRFEMDHRRLPLLDIGSTTGEQVPAGRPAGGPSADSSSSAAAKTSGGGGHSVDDHDVNRGFDSRTNAGYHVSPAVAISRRGGTKRSPYEQSDHLFSSDHHTHPTPSPPNIRNSSAVRYCTPIVTGSERNRLENSNLPSQGAAQGHDDHLHHVTGGGYNRTMNNGGPSPPSSRYDDNHDSHLRHYHRPYPSIRGGTSSPPRYNDGSPQHHHHNTRGSPSHYATPVLMRGNSARERPPYYDHPHPHMPSSYHHRDKENYSYQNTGGYHHSAAGFYSPYGNAMSGIGGAARHPGQIHPDYHQSNPLHHPLPPHNNVKNIDSVVPPLKKQRRNNADPDKPKTKSAAAGKPPRRKKMYSDYVGVTYNKTHAKFQACITHYRKQHYLGRYKLAVDAARAYDKSAKELKGDGWKINFQSDEEYEKAKEKEFADTEKKKKAAAAAKLLQDQEASKPTSATDHQLDTASGPSSYSAAKQSTVRKPENMPPVNGDDIGSTANANEGSLKIETNNSTSTIDTEAASSGQNGHIASEVKVQSTITFIPNGTANASSSAVTPSPHAPNLKKINQASLMKEPLISPLAKASNTNTPLVRKSVFSPTPVKQNLSQSQEEGERKSTTISSNIFSSPLGKQDTSMRATVTETKKLHSILSSNTKTEDSMIDSKKENEDSAGVTTDPSIKQKGSDMPKVEEAENAAQALLMIRN